MKKFIIIIIALIAIVSVAQAQRVFKTTDVIDGQTMLQQAQKIDVDAYLQTKAIYKPGMTESAFVEGMLGSFPKEAESFKKLFAPYFKYIYSFHKRGLPDAKVSGLVTGNEFTTLCNDLNEWNANNPGQLIERHHWSWKLFFEFALKVLDILFD